MSEDLQYDRLKGLDSQLPYGEDLTVTQNVKVSYDNFPKSFDSWNVD